MMDTQEQVNAWIESLLSAYHQEIADELDSTDAPICPHCVASELVDDCRTALLGDAHRLGRDDRAPEVLGQLLYMRQQLRGALVLIEAAGDAVVEMFGDELKDPR